MITALTWSFGIASALAYGPRLVRSILELAIDVYFALSGLFRRLFGFTIVEFLIQPGWTFPTIFACTLAVVACATAATADATQCTADFRPLAVQFTGCISFAMAALFLSLLEAFMERAHITRWAMGLITAVLCALIGVADAGIVAHMCEHHGRVYTAA